MKNEEISKIKLPFRELIYRTICYVFYNMNLFIKISALWFLYILYEIFFSYPILNFDKNVVLGIISFLIGVVASVSIHVKTYRAILLDEEVGMKISLGKRELKYLGYAFLFSVATIFPLILIALRMLSLSKGEISTATILEVFGYIVVFVLYMVNISRFVLVLPAISVDNKEIGLRKSFEMTKGNANKIFWANSIIMLCLYFVYFLALKLIITFGVERDFVAFLYVFVMILVLYFEAFIKSCFLGHVYQYFIFYSNKQNTED